MHSTDGHQTAGSIRSVVYDGIALAHAMPTKSGSTALAGGMEIMGAVPEEYRVRFNPQI